MTKIGRDPLKDIMASRGRELYGKRIALCVTGSVASMEAPSLARELMRHGAEVHSVMSGAAQKLLRADMLEWATGNPVTRSLSGKTEHVRLVGTGAGRADLILIAPCTANTISKVALGIDDTPVTTFASMALGSGIPLVICPAAHEPMYLNQAVAKNLSRLRGLGVEIVEPRIEEGKAKMAESGTIVGSVMRVLAKKDLVGLNVLVTGGPTVEFIDPVRVITNLSSGLMGLSIAGEAWRRGAKVRYVYGGNLAPPSFLPSEKVVTTEQMLRRVLGALSQEEVDVFVAAAAPADFAPERSSSKKISTRKGGFSLSLRPTAKIISAAKRLKPSTFMVAFKAETARSLRELERAAREFMHESGIDMVVANNVAAGQSFGSNYNEVLILSRGRRIFVARDTKQTIAVKIISELVRLLRKRQAIASGDSNYA